MNERDFWLVVTLGALVYAVALLAGRVAELEWRADLFGPVSVQQPQMFGSTSVQRDIEGGGQ